MVSHINSLKFLKKLRDPFSVQRSAWPFNTVRSHDIGHESVQDYTFPAAFHVSAKVFTNGLNLYSPLMKITIS